jgi:hypothetical protein
MHRLIGVTLVLLAGLSGTAAAQQDLDEYIAKIKKAGMTEDAGGSIRTVAAILSGASSFTVERAAEGYRRMYSSALCFRPGTEKSEEAMRLRKEIEDRMEKLFPVLRKLADADGSGFVSSEEGHKLRETIEFGLQVHQMDEADTRTKEALAASFHRDASWVDAMKTAYDRFAQSLTAEDKELVRVTL